MTTTATFCGAAASVTICLLRLVQYRMTLRFLDKHLSLGGDATRDEVCVIIAHRMTAAGRTRSNRGVRGASDQFGASSLLVGQGDSHASPLKNGDGYLEPSATDEPKNVPTVRGDRSAGTESQPGHVRAVDGGLS